MNEGFDKEAREFKKKADESDLEFNCRQKESMDDDEKEECKSMNKMGDMDGKKAKDVYSKDRMKSKNMVFFKDVSYDLESKGLVWLGKIDFTDKSHEGEKGGEEGMTQPPTNTNRRLQETTEGGDMTEGDEKPEGAVSHFRYTIFFTDSEFLTVNFIDKEFIGDNGVVLESKAVKGWEIIQGMNVNMQKDMEIPSKDDPMFQMMKDHGKDGEDGWTYGKDEDGNMQRCRMKPKMDGDDWENKEKDEEEKKMVHVISECNPNDANSCGVDHRCGMATSSNEKYNKVLETIGYHCYKQFFCGKEIDGVRLDCNGYVEEDMEKEPHQKQMEDEKEQERKEQVELEKQRQKLADMKHESEIREEQ